MLSRFYWTIAAVFFTAAVLQFHVPIAHAQKATLCKEQSIDDCASNTQCGVDKQCGLGNQGKCTCTGIA